MPYLHEGKIRGQRPRNLTDSWGNYQMAVCGWRRAAGGGPRRTAALPPSLVEATMKAIFSVALVLGVCGLAGTAEDKSDPVGTWKCEYEIGGEQRTATLVVKKDGDKLAGSMSWPDQKETKVKDLKHKDGNLTFSVEREIMDNKFTVEYKLEIDGDKFKGKAAVEFGGEKREFDIAGNREKKGK
jgi:hypothetical protein